MGLITAAPGFKESLDFIQVHLALYRPVQSMTVSQGFNRQYQVRREFLEFTIECLGGEDCQGGGNRPALFINNQF
jgi:hypothetical protein